MRIDHISTVFMTIILMAKTLERKLIPSACIRKGKEMLLYNS